ncbi:MAG: hypothetical protein ABSG28_02750 [Methanoregula sp.]|jgi:hypothetical protein|uniref:phosphoribosyltransferase-like protein n=1 Tax=Methanoregula sp. TaxID=2052170 RepID=UPI003C209009
MRNSLAEPLFEKIMGWSAADFTQIMPELEALSLFKYDEYQQFFSGMKFIESLACWLSQFETKSEKEIALDFIRSNLIFISSSEMTHLVATSYLDLIRPIIIRSVSEQEQIPEYLTNHIIKSREYQIQHRRSLFLGLSDGAHTDIFRRYNPDISNEQVYQTYEITGERTDEMLKRLNKDLSCICEHKFKDDENRFRMLFLLDDFSGSGKSYLRCDNGKYDGKISRFCTSICDSGNPMHRLIDQQNFKIYIILYVATKKAIQNIKQTMDEAFGEKGISCDVKSAHLIDDSKSCNFLQNTEFVNLLTKYYDNSIENEHYKKGKIDHPYLGFDECALPLILSHNTPNNSLPLLWYEEERKYWGLFPRISRHGGGKDGFSQSV